MEEQDSCSTMRLMLQKLLMYGTFLVREGADMAAAGMLLGSVDMLGRRGPEQDIPGAVSCRHLAFVWVSDGLKMLQNTESVFGALRALQVQRLAQHLSISKTKTSVKL